MLKRATVFNSAKMFSDENFFYSAQYNTALPLSQFFILNFEYLGENETKFENILTNWSVVQTSLNDEKNCGSKISLDCPFNIRVCILELYLLNSVCSAFMWKIVFHLFS